MVALSCPHCGNKKEVIKFGTNRSGTARCRCLTCGRTFTPAPKSRALTLEKQAAIERALAQRVSRSRASPQCSKWAQIPSAVYVKRGTARAVTLA